jgi:acyl-coenzyme A synthetase/AMP-(fatty) acid ligase
MGREPDRRHQQVDCVDSVTGIAGHAALVTSAGDRVSPDAFRALALEAAAALPGVRELLNLCEDRRNFLVAFGAAMLRRRTVLLPPSRAAAAIAELRARYPGCETVDDSFVRARAGMAATDDGGDFIAVIGHTSGSTGAPTAHAKSFRSLAATTVLNARTLRTELARQGRDGKPWIVATVPPQHMYGLETSVLLPLLAGFGLHCGRPLLPVDVATALAQIDPPRVLVSTPVHLRALADSEVDFPEIAIAVSATASLARPLAERIERRLGAALVEFFGSTETCVIATRMTARDERWRPYPGIRLEAAGDGTTVSAPWLPGGQRLHDVIDVSVDGSFKVVGRGSDVIEVAGKRASLADLSRRLLSLGGVVDAVVFQPPPGEGGVAARCAALVVAPGATAAELARELRAQVDPVFVPRPIVLVPELPRNEVGKLPRDKLLELLATAASRPRRGR